MSKHHRESENNEGQSSACTKRIKINERPSSEYTHRDYTVGWVCALSKEMAAATAMLDCKHDNLPKAPNDANAYTLGSIGEHNIVVACLPKGKYGTNSAAFVARDMLSTFPSIRIGLMVGIGGGMPPKVRLGDVVVSTPVGEYPGVVQWDMGKAVEGGGFQRTGALNNPPSSLLTAISHWEADFELKGPQIQRYLDEMKEKYPRMAQKYLRSASLTDVLHKCDAEGGHEKQTQEREPKIHFGLIASGNQVVKDATFRDKRNDDLGGQVLCFEMEAAGLMDNFPCIVIRGICDYADSQKDKAWQEHAAAVSAAFAKELLQHVEPSDVAREMPVKETEGILKKVYKTLSVNSTDLALVKERINNKEDVEILNWLTSTDYGPQQSDNLKRRHPGTGGWLLGHRKFQTWLSNPKQTLFCPGIPGAGKTILTSIVIDHLHSKFHNDLKTGVAYIYCNFKRQNEQQLDSLLSSILKQLSESQPSLSENVRGLHNRHRQKRTRPSSDEVFGVLQSVVATYSRVFIIIDALDECQIAEGCRPKLLSYLFDLQTRHSVNVFATSRFIPEILEQFQTSVSLEISANPNDIARYIKERMPDLPVVVQDDKQLQEEIVLRISEAVDGMFLLAQIYIELLKDKLTLNDIRSAIEIFSKQRGKLGGEERKNALDDAYKQTLERINRQAEGFKKLAFNVLSWIICAKRQLTTSELQHAFATKPGKRELDKGDMSQIQDMVSVCAGLVTVDKESNIIRLIHYTTQEYLIQTRVRWFPRAESAIVVTCVTYLSFDVFETGLCKTDQEFEQRLVSNQLYDYAANYWGCHATDGSESAQTILNFLQDQVKVEASSQALMYEKRNSWKFRGYSEEVPKNMTGLHLVGYFGVSDLVNAILEDGQNADVKDTYGRTPLWYAAKNGHNIIVERLLEEGANVNTADKYELVTVLQVAVREGHLEVVKTLLSNGADVNAASPRYGWTALQVAAREGHLEIVKTLLAKGADVNAANADNDEQTVLQGAAERAHLEVMKMLLTKGADVNAAPPRYGWTALQVAAGEGHLEIVKMLLAKGADVNAAAHVGGGRTALQAAAEGGHLEMVNKLIEAKADVNASAAAHDGFTALAAAAAGGHLDVVNRLIMERADINAAASNNSNLTALQAAANGGHLEVVDRLLVVGADVNVAATNVFVQTALQAAVMGGHLDVMNRLLAAGADVNATNGYGRTALQLVSVALKGDSDIVKRLLAAGADVDADGAGTGNGLPSSWQRLARYNK